MAGITEEKTKRGPRLSLPPPETAPWLVFPCGNTRKMQTFCSVLEGESNKYYVQSIPELRRKDCWSVNHGWLVMLDTNKEYYCLSLFNPVLLETIQLPDLMLKGGRTHSFCFLSSVPTDPDCLVMIFCDTPCSIIYCHPRDKKWSKQSYDLPIWNGIINEAIGIPDGSGTITIYMRTIYSDLAVLDRDPPGGISIRMLNVIKPIPPSDMLHYVKYSIESGGELFHVQVHFASPLFHEVKCIEVFKMDFSNMAWVKVEDLGDRAFFLGNPGYSLSCIGNPELGMGNHIYFTMPKDRHLYVFSLKDDDISCFLPCPDLKTPWYKPYWIMPAANRSICVRRDECAGRTLVYDVNVVPQSKKAVLDEENEKIEMQYSRFTSLPKELQFSIAIHTKSAADYMSLRATCKALRILAPPIQWSSDLTRSVIPVVQSPWLMFFQQEICCFLDPSNNMVYCKKIPKGLSGARIRCSKHGWLLMSRGTHSMFFYDPFSEAKIELPDMAHYSYLSIGFSSPPTSSDCMIFAIRLDEMCFYSLGQERWNVTILEIDVKKPFFPSYGCPVFHNGNFYCLSLDARMGVFKKRMVCGIGNWLQTLDGHVAQVVIIIYSSMMKFFFLCLLDRKGNQFVCTHLAVI